MTLWSVYHTLFGVFATFTVSYITPMVWYSHFIFYSVDWSNVSKVPWRKETTTGATSHYTAFVSFV